MILNLLLQILKFKSYSKDQIYDHRKTKFLQIGRDQGFSGKINMDKQSLSYKDSSLENLKIHIKKNKYLYGGLGIVVIASLIAALL